MPADAKDAALARVTIAGQEVEYRLRPVSQNGKLRLRVGPYGVEVLKPPSRSQGDVEAFLCESGAWIVEQLDRVARLQSCRRVTQKPVGEILLRGEPTPVRVEDVPRRARSNQVRLEPGRLVIIRGRQSSTPPVTTLENWLRRRAREQIALLVSTVADKLGATPGRLYIMDQKTKWGNCSGLGNLSFNWRIVMAPDHVLHYLVTHEVVHLAVPDHSHKFWLTVQGLCPETERARQWLSANGHRLLVPLERAVMDSSERPPKSES